jgi:16S rRNA (cytidine1402-2'-O)-methyltransferase
VAAGPQRRALLRRRLSTGISDPGYRSSAAPRRRRCRSTCCPAPRPWISRAALVRLSTSSYTFKGFPPRKPGALRRFFEEERDLPHTLNCFESPFRVGAALKAAHDALGDPRGRCVH